MADVRYFEFICKDYGVMTFHGETEDEAARRFKDWNGYEPFGVHRVLSEDEYEAKQALRDHPWTVPSRDGWTGD